MTILRTCHSDQRKLGAIKALLAADAINVSRERIRSQEKPPADRTHIETLKAFLGSLSPEERAQLNRLTLRGQSSTVPTPPPTPGGLLPAQGGGEGV
jgi:hypothetical protein